MTSEVRRLGALTEVVHAVVYFAPETAAAYRDLGLRGYWMGYFAGRAAPFGAASPELVTAVFAGFAPAKVRRALPDAWGIASPERVLRARVGGVGAALRRLMGDSDVATAAALTERAVTRLPLPGRPLAAANAALPRPAEPLQGLWHDCTVLREHRGDGHLHAVAAAGLTWPDPHLLLAGLGRLDPRQQQHRGWDDDAWSAAQRRLQDRGWLDPGGAATAAGRAAYADLERSTDLLAAPAYDDVDATRLAGLLEPLARQVVAGGGVPFPNAMGLPPVGG